VPAAADAAVRHVIRGAGFGHGIGMSQYGAQGMAVRGAAASRILAFYYGGAKAGSARLPATIRVGLLQANRDPAAGGRLARVRVQGLEVPGLGGSGRFTVSGTSPGGRIIRRTLPGHVTFSIRPQSGGMSVFDLASKRVFGPTKAGTGVVVRYDASEPVSAVLYWGFGDPTQNRLRFPGPASDGTIKLVLPTTAMAISMQVSGESADGRTGSSEVLTARRLVRRVVLEVRDLTLDIPDGTGGIITRFRGTSFTPLGPGLVGPTASSEPFAFPSSVLGAGASSSPLTLRLSHEAPPDPPRTRLVNLTIPFPRSGQTTLSRVVSGAGLLGGIELVDPVEQRPELEAPEDLLQARAVRRRENGISLSRASASSRRV
jgi:hypothetical protein